MPLYTTDNDETYITTGNVAWNASDSQEAKLKKIITQKWIALYPDGFEAWSEFRRTGYPEAHPDSAERGCQYQSGAGTIRQEDTLPRCRAARQPQLYAFHAQQQSGRRHERQSLVGH